jgi:hypothetical protein
MVMALVLQTMTEGRELCATPDLSLSVEYAKVDVPMILSLPEHWDVGSTPISSHPPHNPDALFAEEFSDMLSKLEAVLD